MGIFGEIIKPFGLNLLGSRRVSAKEKKKLKEAYRRRTGKKTPDHFLQIDHKKPVALHKPTFWWDDEYLGRIEPYTIHGQPRKHSYDRKSNLQVLHYKTHRKKTATDIKKIRSKRQKDLNKMGFGFSREEIIGKRPF